MRLFERRQWEVLDRPFQPEKIPHTETILTIGNGLVGVRGSFEEGYSNDTSATLAAGIFDHAEGELVPELVAMPNWLDLTFSIEGERFSLEDGTLLGYERKLDLRSATLQRGVLWRSPKGRILRLHFERFVSLDQVHIMAIRVMVQPLSAGSHRIDVDSALDGSVRNPGNIDHWARLAGNDDGHSLYLEGDTRNSHYQIAMASSLHITGDADVMISSSTASPQKPAHRASFMVEANQKIHVTKLVALHSSRDSTMPGAAARNSLRSAEEAGYDALHAAHVQRWADYWDAMDIQIDGDEIAQQALRFCLYHLLIAVPQHDEKVSIAAKTLSGYGYKGHVFWDTEFFMIPPLTLCMPDAARRLLMYRYHHLQGARNKAAEAGYEGAMFPWESTDTGEETTPRWANALDDSDEPIRIWTGDNEQHISSDIAYAVLEYWRWTGNDDWFIRYGAELVLDTAVFWGSRAEYNAELDRYELRMQIGPDEYHENVDNSVFTNTLVAWHLREAQHTWDWLQKQAPQQAEALAQSLHIDDARMAKWMQIAEKMWIPLSDEGGGVFEQFEGFFERLKAFNLSDYAPRTKNMDWILGQRLTQQRRVIKQADVVMLMSLFMYDLGDHDFLMRNWDLYSRVVDHGSSLSPSVHARVAARLGLIEEAYELFIHSATIDIADHKGNVHDGVHAASCGGVWQAIVFGFCGLQISSNGIEIDPKLPEHWRRVSFQVRHQGQILPIEIINHENKAKQT